MDFPSFVTMNSNRRDQRRYVEPSGRGDVNQLCASGGGVTRLKARLNRTGLLFLKRKPSHPRRGFLRTRQTPCAPKADAVHVITAALPFRCRGASAIGLCRRPFRSGLFSVGRRTPAGAAHDRVFFPRWNQASGVCSSVVFPLRHLLLPRSDEFPQPELERKQAAEAPARQVRRGTGQRPLRALDSLLQSYRTQYSPSVRRGAAVSSTTPIWS